MRVKGRTLCGMPWRALIGVLLLGTLCLSLPAWQQPTFAEVEKKIATLPNEQRVYERFRFWITQIPRDQMGKDIPERYVVYLTRNGFARADAEEQIKIVDRVQAKAEVERWNRILTSPKPSFNTKPNDFLVEMAKNLKAGTALDVGMGQGRNAIWLAQQGWDVTGFDPAEKAVALAEKDA